MTSVQQEENRTAETFDANQQEVVVRPMQREESADWRKL
jgi:hypothetical protein